LKKNCNKLNNHLFFIGIFHFLGSKLEFEQALFHSCLPFLDFLSQGIHFCKYDWVDLIETNLKFLQFFSLVVAYWHALEKTCPKQALTY
jgi:hypothetical protein